MRVRTLWCLIVLGVTTVRAAASDGTLNWSFQTTGFPAYGGSTMQTALAMRDGFACPVIFSPASSGKLEAYSMYPVLNPTSTRPTYWQQIGVDVLPTVGGPLSAASSSDGRVGAVVRNAGTDPQLSAAVIGGSGAGFGAHDGRNGDRFRQPRQSGDGDDEHHSRRSADARFADAAGACGHRRFPGG